MTPVIVAYLILFVFILMAALMAIDILIKRFMPIGCILVFLGFVLAAFVYTLNH